MSADCERCNGSGLRGAHHGHDGLVGITGRHYAELQDAKRLLDLREQQLADCTRAMREVSTTLRAWEKYLTDNAPTSIDQKRFGEQADKLDAARAGKAVT